jgi:hypothetical protein
MSPHPHSLQRAPSDHVRVYSLGFDSASGADIRNRPSTLADRVAEVVVFVSAEAASAMPFRNAVVAHMANLRWPWPPAH